MNEHNHQGKKNVNCEMCISHTKNASPRRACHCVDVEIYPRKCNNSKYHKCLTEKMRKICVSILFLQTRSLEFHNYRKIPLSLWILSKFCN